MAEEIRKSCQVERIERSGVGVGVGVGEVVVVGEERGEEVRRDREPIAKRRKKASSGCN